MYSKGLVTFALLAALLMSSAALQPENSASGADKGRNILQRLLTRPEKVKDPGSDSVPARFERRAHLSEEEREIMAKQVVHAISELMNSECMSDRDYQGWVDFGRRDVDMA